MAVRKKLATKKPRNDVLRFQSPRGSELIAAVGQTTTRIPQSGDFSRQTGAHMAADILTKRLRLRTWVAADREPFAALNADAQVMEHFPAPLSRAESDALADRIEAKFQEQGFVFWAVEVPGVVRFARFIGLSVPTFEAHFTPCVEIGWRLARPYWGQGFATEGASATLRHAFGTLNLPAVVAFTAQGNARSRRVMEKLGMHYDLAGDFDHPSIPAGHPLCRHVLYRINRPELPSGAVR